MCLKFAGLSDRRHSQDPLLGTRGSQHPIASPQSALNQSSAPTYGTQHKLHIRLKPGIQKIVISVSKVLTRTTDISKLFYFLLN